MLLGSSGEILAFRPHAWLRLSLLRFLHHGALKPLALEPLGTEVGHFMGLFQGVTVSFCARRCQLI